MLRDSFGITEGLKNNEQTLRNASKMYVYLINWFVSLNEKEGAKLSATGSPKPARGKVLSFLPSLSFLAHLSFLILLPTGPEKEGGR